MSELALQTTTPYVNDGMTFFPLLVMPLALLAGVTILLGGGLVAHQRRGGLSPAIATGIAVAAALLMTAVGRLSMDLPAGEVEIVVAAATLCYPFGTAIRQRATGWLAGILCMFIVFGIAAYRVFPNTLSGVTLLALLGGVAPFALGYWLAR